MTRHFQPQTVEGDRVAATDGPSSGASRDPWKVKLLDFGRWEEITHEQPAPGPTTSSTRDLAVFVPPDFPKLVEILERDASLSFTADHWMRCADAPEGMSIRGDAAVLLFAPIDLRRAVTLAEEIDRVPLHQAIELLSKLTKRRELAAAAWLNLGIVRAALGRNDEALIDIDKAIECRRADGAVRGEDVEEQPGILRWPEAHYHRGRILIEAGRYSEAEAALAVAVRQDESNARAHYHRARAIRRLIARDLRRQAEESSRCYLSLGAPLGLDEDLEPFIAPLGRLGISRRPDPAEIILPRLTWRCPMNDQLQPSPNYHVLLIGIDAYTVKPLHGCVNDIDAIQRLLLDERVAIPKDRIRRLASPHPGSTHETTVGSAPATLDNICTALESLGSSKVKENDRVFIYYSGHGARTPVRTAANDIFHREALVPVDINTQPGAVLFDFDLNRLLAAIVARTSAVAVVLDCCHSAGATRELPVTGMTSRVMEDLSGAKPLPLSHEKEILAAASARGVAGNVDDCQVVAACLNHELAQESTGRDGVPHGLLTRALVEQLRALPDTSLREVPWGRIWEGVRTSVEAANVTQHVWMAGSAASAVIAGPRIDGDVGFTIKRTGPNNAYTINAGTLVGLTKGAKVAVYKSVPLRFPPLELGSGQASALHRRSARGERGGTGERDGGGPGRAFRLASWGPRPPGRAGCARSPPLRVGAVEQGARGQPGRFGAAADRERDKRRSLA